MVDDSIVTLMTKRLKKAGHIVDEASTGAVALEMMKWRKYDVVLMDLLMPVMVSHVYSSLVDLSRGR